MRRTKRIQRRRRSGFTLLEILLVVGIIALLAAFVVPNFMNTKKEANKKMAGSMVSEGGTLGTAVSLFHNSMGRYPKELSELYEKPDDDDEAAKWAGPYINPNAMKDPWGRELKYKGPEDAEFNKDRFDLYSLGPDGEDESDDDIGNWTKEE